MPIVRQESFAGGELSPKLWARTRHARYPIGARGILNFIPTPFGDLANRPGNELCEADTLVQTCIATGTNVCEKSAVGITWASKTIGTGAWRGIAHSGSMWVVVGGSGAIRISTNGESWAAPTSVVGTSVTSYQFYSVAYSPVLDRWVAIGAHPYFMTSADDGDNWVECSALPVGVGGTTWYSVTWGRNRFVAVGNTGKTLYSENGLDWLEGDDTGQQQTSVVYAPFLYGGSGGFVSVAAGGGAQHSPDGQSWTLEAGMDGTWQEVAVSDSMLVAVAPTGTYHSMKSTDGITWEDAGILASSAWRSICWQGDLWVAVGTACQTSPDGVTWTSRTITGGHFAVASAFVAAQEPDRRLIPFVFSDQQTLVLEFRDSIIRFIEDGAYVEAGGSPYELATPYAAADLARLKYAQMGNIITITHPSYTPRELERTATAPLTFTLTTVGFDVPECPDIGGMKAEIDSTETGYPGDIKPYWNFYVTAICQSLDGTRRWETKPYTLYGQPLANDIGLSDWDSGVTYAINDVVDYGAQAWRSRNNGNIGNTPVYGDLTWWQALSIGGTTIGKVDLAFMHRLWFGPSLPLAPVWTWVTPTTYRILKWCLYRGPWNADPGFVVMSDGGAIGEAAMVEPDYLRRPPKGENPFKIYDEDDVLVRTEKPTCVAYHDGRLIFGGTVYRPNYIFASRLGDWHNFDQYPIVVDDDSITFGLAGRRFEEIRSMVPGRSLLVFTTSGEWAVDGGQPGQPIRPTSLSARQRTERGSIWLDALKVGDDHVLFVQRKGTTIRDLAYDGQSTTYNNLSVSLFSQHLFAGKEVVDWCWQEDPWSVVWAVLDDGSLVSLTFLPEEKVLAWARHEIGGNGFVESICSIPEGEEDAIYMVVRRGVYRGIERMTTRQVADSEEGVFLDSSLSFTFGTATTAITGLDHLEGESVYALADGLVQGPFTVASGAITLTTAANRVHVGMQYNSDFESLDCPPGEGKTRVKAIREAWVELEASAGSIQAGETFTALETWSRVEADEAAPVDGLITGQAHIPTISHWNHGGRVCIRQSDPLPCTILAVARDVEYG